MVSQNSAGGREEPVGTAASSVAESLVEMILGQMSPGSSLPSEAELATQFSVSRLTIREAVKMLEGRGLVELPQAGLRPTLASCAQGYAEEDLPLCR